MALPESYDDATLADFMVTELGPTATALGWTDASDQITEAVNEVAAILGSDIADVDDVLKLRTIARWQAWSAAEAATANQYRLGSDGSTLNREQWFAQIGVRLARAEASARRYSEVEAYLAGGGGTAYVTTASLGSSPYGWSSSEFG